MQERTYLSGPLSYDVYRQGLIYYASFLIWPFAVMIDAFRHWRQPWAKNIFWLFCFFFGYTFVIASGDEGSADSARYAQSLVEYANSDHNLKTLFRSFYSETSSNVDIAQPLITYLVSRFTVDPHVLFAVFALIFGYFHSRNVWYILYNLNNQLGIISGFLLFVFIILNPVWNINGVRMWTAAHIFIFGVLPFLMEGKVKKLYWSFFSVFFHFSFIMPVIILCIYILARNRINVYIVLFFITSFIKEIDLQAVQSYLSFLPSAFQSRTAGYTNLDYAESIALADQALNWYIPLASKGLTWAIYLIVIYIFFFSRAILTERKGLMNLFCFAVLLYSIANILSLVPSGSRFIYVASAFIIAFYIIFISTFPKVKGFSFVQIISIPLLLLYCIVGIRAGMDYYGLMTLIGNPILAVFNQDSVPLIEGIKQIFL